MHKKCLLTFESQVIVNDGISASLYMLTPKILTNQDESLHLQSLRLKSKQNALWSTLILEYDSYSRDKTTLTREICDTGFKLRNGKL